MANIQQVREALRTHEGPITTTALATKLEASVEGTRKQLKREREKGNVEGGSEEGWQITDAGRAVLKKEETGPSMIEEGVTPRQQFEAIGQRIGFDVNRIKVATDIVWSGDFNDITWVWEGLRQADIAADLRNVWVNSWRAKLNKAIPPELEGELTKGAAEALKEAEIGTEKGVGSKKRGRDFIIVEDEPVRVGENLGDYTLQDAKDILAVKALRHRFAAVGQQGTSQQPAASEKVSEVLTALSPYLNKGSDMDTIREVLADKMEIMKQQIVSTIPQEPPNQPPSFLDQITGLSTALAGLKDVGPLIRNLLGIPEAGGNSGGNSGGSPVSITGPDGKPMITNLGDVIGWKQFLAGQRREDERHDMLMGLGKTVRDVLPDGVAALQAAAKEIQGAPGAKTKTLQQKPGGYRCGDCETQFGAPAEWAGQPLKCPGCDRVYTKEELEA